MASRRLTRESLDAIIQAKAKRYRLDRSDPVDEALHQLRVHSRPVARTASRYDETFLDDTKPRSDWRADTREDFSLPSYRSSSPVVEEDDYYDKGYSHPSSRNRDYAHPSSRQRDYGRSSSTDRDYSGLVDRDREYDRPASQKREYEHSTSRKISRLHDTDYSSSDLLSGFRSLGHLEEDYSTIHSQDNDFESEFEMEREPHPPSWRGRGRARWRGRGRARGKRGMATPGMVKDKRLTPVDDELPDPLERPKPRMLPSDRPQFSQRSSLAVRRGALHSLRRGRIEEPNLDLTDSSNIFSTFGVEIMKWAGFSQVKKDAEYSELYRVLFLLETETCAKMLASFKCSLKPEHRDFCFSVVKPLQHPALRTPKVDNKFLDLLLKRRVVKTKNCLFKVIRPFDQYIMWLQDRLLKSTTPLLMACNAYELSTKSSNFSDQVQMAATLDSTISLCRKSLALLGQTFALASTIRQEKILEAIGVHRYAPSPTLYPNFDNSALFGREYIEILQNWMEKSGCSIVLKEAPERSAPKQKDIPEARPKTPQRADRKAAETIEKLVNIMISDSLKDKEKAELKDKPEYWFLNQVESLEYKYYKLKLSEMERMMSTPKEGRKENTAEQGASESMRAILYARKVAGIKRRLFKKKRPGILLRAARARKVKKSTIATQTLLSAGMMLKQPCLHSQGSAAASAGAGSTSDEAGPPVCIGDAEEVPPSGDDPAAVPSVDVSGPAPSSACPFPGVDEKTMETAEKLAKFVAQVGPEIEQFSIDNSADNPDLWFLQDRDSSAFRFYRAKVYELCPSINFSSVQDSADPSKSSAHEGDGEEEEELDKEASQTETGKEGDEEEDMHTEDGDKKTAEPSNAEQGQASTSSEGVALKPAGQVVSSAPRQRKRISSKSLKVGMIPALKRVCHVEDPQVHEPVRIAYDRPRGYQSYKRKKFPRQKGGKDTDFTQKRLNQKNIGFQMLKKMGWQEGRGLGSHGDGIREPIKVGSTSSGEGLGVAGKKKEDTFDTFRQRMINMYNLKRGCK